MCASFLDSVIMNIANNIFIKDLRHNQMRFKQSTYPDPDPKFDSQGPKINGGFLLVCFLFFVVVFLLAKILL